MPYFLKAQLSFVLHYFLVFMVIISILLSFFQVWTLWNADNTIALIDPMVYEPHFEMEVLRCIQVGMLCVQEFAHDRPIISVVVSMLKSEIFDMPRPKKLAFTEKQIALDTNSSLCIQTKCSINSYCCSGSTSIASCLCCWYIHFLVIYSLWALSKESLKFS